MTDDSPCTAGWDGLYVDHTGRCSVCCLTISSHPIGHLAEQPVEEILNSEAAQQMRRMLRAHDYSACVSYCGFYEARVRAGKPISKPARS